jgi:hypothetical protein
MRISKRVQEWAFPTAILTPIASAVIDTGLINAIILTAWPLAIGLIAAWWHRNQIEEIE